MNICTMTECVKLSQKALSASNENSIQWIVNTKIYISDFLQNIILPIRIKLALN